MIMAVKCGASVSVVARLLLIVAATVVVVVVVAAVVVVVVVVVAVLFCSEFRGLSNHHRLFLPLIMFSSRFEVEVKNK